MADPTRPAEKLLQEILQLPPEQAAARLHEIMTHAYSDSVTGGLNRQALTLQFDRAHEIALRDGVGYAILALDLNRFKAVNDTFGHPEGDNVLRKVHDTLKWKCRTVDIVARTGGDEFIVVLPNADETIAVKVAKRVREGIEEAGQRPGDKQHSVTASIGIALFDPATMSHVTPSDMLKLVDVGIQKPKGREANEEYRNRVVLVASDGTHKVVDRGAVSTDAPAEPAKRVVKRVLPKPAGRG